MGGSRGFATLCLSVGCNIFDLHSPPLVVSLLPGLSRSFGVGIDVSLLASQSANGRGSVLLGRFPDRYAAGDHRALVFSRHGCVLDLSGCGGAARDELDHMGILAQPAMPGNFE